MSRAFVNEDSCVDSLPDRPVSEHPNLATEPGLVLIGEALEAARRDYAAAQAASDRERLASAGRDLRYWSARRATAQPRTPVPSSDVVQFGHSVTIARDDGRRQTFRIVGEDEADIKGGLLSVTSPLARALIGKGKGDSVEVATPRGAKSYEVVTVDFG